MQHDSTTNATRLASRMVWVVLILSILLTLVAVPYRIEELSQPCLGVLCENDRMALTPAVVTELVRLGITLEEYAIFQTGIVFLQVAFCWGLAVLLLRRGKRDRITLLVAFNLALGGFSNSILNALFGQSIWAALPAAALTYLGYVSFILVYYLFPDGRFVPGWTRWLAALLAGSELVYTITTMVKIFVNPEFGLGIIESFVALVWVFSYFAVTCTQLYRYFRISNPVQRVQTRWVVYGISVFVTCFLILIVSGLVLDLEQDPRYQLFFALATSWFSMVLPASLTVAILRYRLWDIDLIIRRTLQYSVLTAVLVIVYFFSVLILQSVIMAVGGQSSTLVTVLSTLLIAALFNPLRRRIQQTIDRRFYRQKYNAEKAMAKFSEIARNETDPNRLTSRLIQVIGDVLQPEEIAVWLKPISASEKAPGKDRNSYEVRPDCDWRRSCRCNGCTARARTGRIRGPG